MTIAQQAEAARKRLQAFINRSAGQHIRAMRKAAKGPKNET